MTATVFVTGTDTGVGKTVVSCALVRGLRQLRKRVAVVKPVAAGCEQINGRWCNDDALALQFAAGNWQDYGVINPFALPAAIAPHLAAKEARMQLSVRAIAPHIETARGQNANFCVIEGAGGFLVPLNDTETMADLAHALATPVILVVAMRLGCINHALLSAAAIRGKGLRLLGWVANQPEADAMPHHDDNVAYLRTHLAAPLLAEFHWQQDDATHELRFATQVIAAFDGRS